MKVWFEPFFLSLLVEKQETSQSAEMQSVIEGFIKPAAITIVVTGAALGLGYAVMKSTTPSPEKMAKVSFY